MMRLSCFTWCLVLTILTPHVITQFAGTIHNGVGIGGWLLAESWMYPDRWAKMGGERCDKDASSCATTEWSLVKKLGQTQANEVFLNHWKTWFAQEHVDRIKALNLDHVKISLGFWIIEELVQQPAEMYPQGGWMELKRGLRQLKGAGINVLFSMHALPGVSTANQNFAGNNTDQVHFYQDANYRRALTWAAVLTAMSHLDPDFQRVLGILCINEPVRDTAKTPGLEQYYADFVTIVRVVEFALAVRCDVDLQPSIQRMAASHNVIPALLAAIPLLNKYAAKADPPVDVKPLTSSLTDYCHGSSNSPPHSNTSCTDRFCITTMAMPKTTQWQNDSASMAPHALGPRAYDDHLYFAYGGVAKNATYESYLDTICSFDRIETAKANGEAEYGVGEFSLATNFDATVPQLKGWGDAQKLYSSKALYRTFWTFRIEDPATPDRLSLANQWSYFRAFDLGLLPAQPAQMFNASICQGRENKVNSI